MTAVAIPPGAHVYAPRGSALEAIRCRADEVILDGPAGTGKSRAWLEKIDMLARKYAGCRIAVVRKTRASLTETALVTWEQHVKPGCDTANQQRRVRQNYVYPNTSEVVIAGLDNPVKLMSAEFDFIFVQEATEASLSDWESLTTRLRNGVIPYQQVVGDVNPAHPTHWLKKRMDAGLTTRILARHEDNPRLYDKGGSLTPFGATYIARLDRLTGPRYLRLRKGVWAAAEGIVYDNWDASRHLVTLRDLGLTGLPEEWPRIRVIDFGFTHPFVCQWWAIDPDGRMVRYREIYRTRRLVEDHARDILALEAETGERITATICDHDAEDRATLERHLGCRTLAAYKAVGAGIQAVQARLRVQEDGRPRLYLLMDALVERDPNLVDEDTGLTKAPTCTEEEVEEYVWATGTGGQEKEVPVKDKDHGLDATRYAVAWADRLGTRSSHESAIAALDDYAPIGLD